MIVSGQHLSVCSSVYCWVSQKSSKFSRLFGKLKSQEFPYYQQADFLHSYPLLSLVSSISALFLSSFITYLSPYLSVSALYPLFFLLLILLIFYFKFSYVSINYTAFISSLYIEKWLVELVCVILVGLGCCLFLKFQNPFGQVSSSLCRVSQLNFSSIFSKD